MQKKNKNWCECSPGQKYLVYQNLRSRGQRSGGHWSVLLENQWHIMSRFTSHAVNNVLRKMDLSLENNRPRRVVLSVNLGYLLNLLTLFTRRDCISSKLTQSLLTPATESVPGLIFSKPPTTSSSFCAISGCSFGHSTLSNIQATTYPIFTVRSNNKDQSNLAKCGITVVSPPTTSFLFTRWQHRTDGLAAICNCTIRLGVRPPNLPFPWEAETPI